MKRWIDGYDDRGWRTTADGTIKYALVGLGWWTTDVAIPAIDGAELGKVTVLVSSSAEKAQRIAAENGIERGISYDEYHEGAASDAYDAVYIGTPNAYHLPYAETAAELGKAVLCEKPMEATVERAERLVERCEDGDVPLMIAYRMHTHPAVRRVRELVEAGFIGEPATVYGTNSQPLLEMIPDPGQWRLNLDLTGYGTSVMDLGIYSLNTTRFVLRRDPVEVQADMSSHHEAFEDVPDERASVRLRLEGGVHMVCTTSQNAHNDSHLKITGTEGQIDIRPAFHGECRLELSRNGVTVEVRQEEFDVTDEMREEFDYFADRVLSGEDVYADGEHGLEDMRVIRAIHESAERSEPVEL